MSLPQRKFREVVIQVLFALEAEQNSVEHLVRLLAEQNKASVKNMHDAVRRAEHVLRHRDQIDAFISEASETFKLERIGKVELAAMRLLVFEMKIEKEIEPAVAIAEAIRLSKKYSSPESLKFVNAIMDAIHKKLEG